MKKRILGGRGHACPACGGTVIFVQIPRLGVVSTCKECGCTVNGRIKDEIVIYSYEDELYEEK